ncbi:MAG: hypothetical protein IPN79_05555 [Saprospiraceae bacterium]|nr:hypothetical protein [Saprospiraceae bacterium]
MSLGIEPKGVDLIVEPTKRSKEDIELVSKAIAHYKATGEITKAPIPKTKQTKTKKELITKP